MLDLLGALRVANGTHAVHPIGRPITNSQNSGERVSPELRRWSRSYAGHLRIDGLCWLHLVVGVGK